MLVAYAACFEKSFVIASKSPGFTMSKGNAKAQEMTGNLSAESIVIRRESDWIQMRWCEKRLSG